MIFDPEQPAAPAWLSIADHAQLQRDLTDLPALAAQLDRHYHDLAARGEADPADRKLRAPARGDVLDLADRRWKTPAYDPAGEADLARRIGARRQGILPTLGSWVSCAAGEMHDADQWHQTPADPDQLLFTASPSGEIRVTRSGPTVATEARWLADHLDWIATQQWVTELAADLRDIVVDLAALGVTLEGPDHHATGTIAELADALDIPAATLRSWVTRGWLTPLNDKRPRTYSRRDVLAVRHNSRS